MKPRNAWCANYCNIITTNLPRNVSDIVCYSLFLSINVWLRILIFWKINYLFRSKSQVLGVQPDFSWLTWFALLVVLIPVMCPHPSLWCQYFPWITLVHPYHPVQVVHNYRLHMDWHLLLEVMFPWDLHGLLN